MAVYINWRKYSEKSTSNGFNTHSSRCEDLKRTGDTIELMIASENQDLTCKYRCETTPPVILNPIGTVKLRKTRKVRKITFCTQRWCTHYLSAILAALTKSKSSTALPKSALFSEPASQVWHYSNAELTNSTSLGGKFGRQTTRRRAIALREMTWHVIQVWCDSPETQGFWRYNRIRSVRHFCFN